VKLRHLFGQKLADLIALSERIKGTPKQVRAFSNALELWREVEVRRQYLAHGVASVSHDNRRNWIVMFDMVSHRSNTREPLRWAVKQEEAEQFLANLEQAFKQLSAQLGNFRKRLSA